MSIDRQFLVFALVYAVAGMLMGIYMAASKDHSLHVAHAHILLVGFVASLIYGIIHKLWLAVGASVIARAQFVLHHAAAIILSAGLTLLYGKVYPPEDLDPILAGSSIAVLVAALLMLYMAIRSGDAKG